jgi:hypothetical protein
MSDTDNKPKAISRRDFIATSAMAGAGVMLPHSLRAAGVAGGSARKRFAHVGTGSRSRFYRGAIEDKYAPYAAASAILTRGDSSCFKARFRPLRARRFLHSTPLNLIG